MATGDHTVDDAIKMFGPLTFEQNDDDVSSLTSNQEADCLLCDDKFNLTIAFPLFLRHLFEVHRLVIEDVQNIPRFDSYVSYWKRRFQEHPIETIIPAVKIDSTEDVYFFLSTLSKDDQRLRHKLQLEATLQQQERERSDATFKRGCLFCRLDFEGTRCDFVKHLSTKHNLHLGKPENLVHIGELLELIETKLDNLQCIYCEKTFPERNVLKEHMRKKLHKRINPTNGSYDRFYVVNYLEDGKTWKHIQREDDGPPVNADDEWDDWNEDDGENVVCLFCAVTQSDVNKACDHMRACHDFDFHAATATLDFYQKVKFVNYARRQVYGLRCVACDLKCESDAALKEHMRSALHVKLPDSKVYDRPEFYFPTYENDVFLYFLEDIVD